MVRRFSISGLDISQSSVFSLYPFGQTQAGVRGNEWRPVAMWMVITSTDRLQRPVALVGVRRGAMDVMSWSPVRQIPRHSYSYQATSLAEDKQNWSCDRCRPPPPPTPLLHHFPLLLPHRKPYGPVTDSLRRQEYRSFKSLMNYTDAWITEDKFHSVVDFPFSALAFCSSRDFFFLLFS